MTEPSRYPLRNAEPDEAARLDSLQNLRDASTIRHFERLGVAAGWRCVELGAGGGSIARWLAGRVGATGSVTAIDNDTSLFADLAAMAHVRVIQDDLTTMEFGSACFDLVHSRAVLMHVNNPAGVVERVVGALAPAGVVFFEEVDGAPAQEASRDPALPHAFRAVLLPMAAQWTWARGPGRAAAVARARRRRRRHARRRVDWGHTIGGVLGADPRHGAAHRHRPGAHGGGGPRGGRHGRLRRDDRPVVGPVVLGALPRPPPRLRPEAAPELARPRAEGCRKMVSPR